MSFGAGHIQDMNNRLKQNRGQRPSNRPKFKDHYKGSIYSTSDSKASRVHFKSLSKAELEEIKYRIRKQAEKERKKERIIYGITLSVTILTIIIFLKWIN